jgi:hypothetical protein
MLLFSRCCSIPRQPILFSAGDEFVIRVHQSARAAPRRSAVLVAGLTRGPSQFRPCNTPRATALRASKDRPAIHQKSLSAGAGLTFSAVLMIVLIFMNDVFDRSSLPPVIAEPQPLPA